MCIRDRTKTETKTLPKAWHMGWSTWKHIISPRQQSKASGRWSSSSTASQCTNYTRSFTQKCSETRCNWWKWGAGSLSYFFNLPLAASSNNQLGEDHCCPILCLFIFICLTEVAESYRPFIVVVVIVAAIITLKPWYGIFAHPRLPMSLTKWAKRNKARLFISTEI